MSLKWGPSGLFSDSMWIPRKNTHKKHEELSVDALRVGGLSLRRTLSGQNVLPGLQSAPPEKKRFIPVACLVSVFRSGITG